MSEWNKVEDVLPDDESTVLIAQANGEVWMGYLDAGQWLDLSGIYAESPVTHWRHLPPHPNDEDAP